MSLSQLHEPVLLEETIRAVTEHFDLDQKFCGVDGTFGRGGHSVALLKKFPKLKIIGLDQDQDAVDYANDQFSDLISENRLDILKTNFADHEKIENSLKEEIQFVFLDIGVSSPQLDNAERGFSFYNDGPLDMRMDQSNGLKASEILNTFDLEDLRALFLKYGEVYASDKVLDHISNFRDEKNFSTTLEFANLIERCCGWRKKGVHPATLYFQALRIFVNKELESLEEALSFFTKKLQSGGVFAVITFHSLEDRIVKQFFKNNALGKPVNKKVIKPTRDEEMRNKRARSAKLRVFKKYEAGEAG